MKQLLLNIFDIKCNLIAQVIWSYELPKEKDIIRFKCDKTGKEVSCRVTQKVFNLSDSSIILYTDYGYN